MRRILFMMLLSSAAISALGQGRAESQIVTVPSDLQSEPDAQEGCPVRIVAASFERPGQVMLTGERSPSSQVAPVSGPALLLDYKNTSGKNIESILLTGWIKVKDSPYQLDSVAHPFQLLLSRKALLDKDAEGSETLKLASNAFGFDRVELAHLTYSDGTTWKAERRNCVYHANFGLERAEAR